jgi:PadR family transcriptional regulator PadR
MVESELGRKFQRELNAGLTALIVLAVVKRAKRPVYGYEVATQLTALATHDLPMSQGALYPVLRSLERLNLLTSHIEASPAGPPRKYYALTPQGERTLSEWQEAWSETKKFVDRVLETSHGKQPRNSGRRSALS